LRSTDLNGIDRHIRASFDSCSVCSTTALIDINKNQAIERYLLTEDGPVLNL
jgi:hypothetical protein